MGKEQSCGWGKTGRTEVKRRNAICLRFPVSICPMLSEHLAHSWHCCRLLQDGHIAAPHGACPLCAGVCECGKNKPACVQRGISGCLSAGRKTEQTQEDSESRSVLRSLTVAAKGLSEEVALEGLGKELPGRGATSANYLSLDVKRSVSSSSL